MNPNPLATRTWWLAFLLTVIGLVLGALDHAFRDVASRDPTNTYAAIGLVAIGMISKAITSHGVSIQKAAQLLLLALLPLGLMGCLSGDVKAGAAALDRDLPPFIARSQPASGQDPAAWGAAGDAIKREARAADLAANGAPVSATAKP